MPSKERRKKSRKGRKKRETKKKGKKPSGSTNKELEMRKDK